MVPAFLIVAIQNFYEVLNARALRRRLCDLYVSSTLAFQGSVSALGWFTAVPSPRALRSMVTRALSYFLEAAVERMQQLQFVYNGQGLRGGRQFQVGQASCGAPPGIAVQRPALHGGARLDRY